MFTSVGRTLSM